MSVKKPLSEREEATVDFGIKRYQVYFYSIPPESYATSSTATIFLYDTSDV